MHFVSCLKSEHFYKLSNEISFYEPKFKRSNNKLNKLLFYLKLLLFIRNRVRQIDPERILVFGDWFCPITLLALYGTKYKVFISDRTIPN